MTPSPQRRADEYRHALRVLAWAAAARLGHDRPAALRLVGEMTDGEILMRFAEAEWRLEQRGDERT